MANVFLYAHGGSGNHGCEAIVRSTLKILQNEEVTLISSRPGEDTKYGLGKLCNVIEEKSSNISKTDIDFWKAYFCLKLKHNYIPMEKLVYKKAFSRIKKGDFAISIGGDNYCYADVNRYIMIHDMLKEQGAKTILWGCSVEPEIAQQPEVAADLKRYDWITARETISYNVLKKINPNTILVSDPAFQLDKKETKLPKGFIKKNTVGINLSPMVVENESIAGITWENYIFTIEYILNCTDMSVCLIPHVVWGFSNDLEQLNKLYDIYSDNERVSIVEDKTCQELKDVISQCRFFIGARTHSTIAAYSTGVPTLVLGYSVKARGIARDLFGSEEGYLISVQDLKSADELANAFKQIVINEKRIIREYEVKLKQYIEKAKWSEF